MNVIIFNDTRPTNHFGCWRVMSNLEKLLSEQGFTVFQTFPVNYNWEEQKHKLPPKNADIKLVIVNGEGTLHHSQDRPRAQYLANIPEFARQQWNAPTVLINATIYNNDDLFYSKLKSFSSIWVRDKASQKELLKYDIVSGYCPDLTMVYDYPYFFTRKKHFVTDSVLSDITEALINHSKKNTDKIWKPMQLKRKPAELTLSNFPTYPLKLLRGAFAEQQLMKQPDSYLQKIASSKTLITGRYHAVAYALLTKTPFLAFSSNTPKIEFLLNDVFQNTKRVIPQDVLLKNTDIKVPPLTAKEEKLLDQFLAISKVQAQEMLNTLKNIAAS